MVRMSLVTCMMLAPFLVGSSVMAQKKGKQTTQISFVLGSKTFAHTYDSSTGGQTVTVTKTVSTGGSQHTFTTDGRAYVLPVTLKRPLGIQEFRVELQGATDFSVHKASLGLIQAEKQDVTKGTDPHRRYVLGKMKVGDVTLIGSASPTVQTWWEKTQQGQMNKRSLKVTLSGAMETRTYTYIDCQPVSYSTTTSEGQTVAALVVRPVGVEVIGKGPQAPVGVLQWLTLQAKGKPSKISPVTVGGTSYSDVFILSHTLTKLDAAQPGLVQEEVTLMPNLPLQ